jgi:glycine dehydrogenase subunit 2
MITKVTQHLSQNEALLFERSSPGKKAYQLPELDVPAVDATVALGAENVRREIEGFPEVSEVEAIRHFTRLSTWNYAIDHGMYPLGSCTMKYNPRINEVVARTEGLAWAHPYQPESLSQGCLEVMARLEAALAEICGMDAVTLQPGAGAHGELTGILLIRALLEKRGDPRKTILIPDSAHGTNPATAAIAGYAVENIKSSETGGVDLGALEQLVTSDVAALMVTNPNTLGVFENNIVRVAEILHKKGAMLYMDGANMNALVGIARPGDFGVDVMHLNLHKTFSTPHGGGGPGAGPVAVKKALEPFLPTTTASTPSAASKPTTATSACWSAPWPTSRRMAVRDCATPPWTPCSTRSTSARGWNPTSICPTRRPTCTRWSSATNGRRNSACAPAISPSASSTTASTRIP